MKGDLRLESTTDGKQNFIFYVSCQKTVLRSNSMTINSSHKISDENKISLTKILLISQNVLDRLAIIHTLNELSLKDKLIQSNSTEDAVDKVLQLFIESNGLKGFAFIIFDLGLEH